MVGWGRGGKGGAWGFLRMFVWELQLSGLRWSALSVTWRAAPGVAWLALAPFPPFLRLALSGTDFWSWTCDIGCSCSDGLGVRLSCWTDFLDSIRRESQWPLVSSKNRSYSTNWERIASRSPFLSPLQEPWTSRTWRPASPAERCHVKCRPLCMTYVRFSSTRSSSILYQPAWFVHGRLRLAPERVFGV